MSATVPNDPSARYWFTQEKGWIDRCPDCWSKVCKPGDCLTRHILYKQALANPCLFHFLVSHGFLDLIKYSESHEAASNNNSYHNK